MVASFDTKTPNTVREMIAWLLSLGRPPLPECPIEAVKVGKEPKAPCFFDGRRVISINWKHWQKQQPIADIYQSWFTHPQTGIGTLGGWNGKHWLGWIDFDQKDFSSAEECDRSVGIWLSQYQILITAPMFRTPNGGYRFLVAFAREPENFKANSGFSLQPDGSHHVGELLIKNGAHTLLPPTIGVNGKAYQWERWSEYPPVVEKPEDVGLYRVQKRTESKPATPINRDAPRGNTTLSDFLTNTIYPNLSAEVAYNWYGHDFKADGDKLRGNCPWHESASGTAFYVDAKDGTHLWRCPACEIGGGVVEYRHRLDRGNGQPRGKEFVDIVRQLAADVGVEMPKNTRETEETSRDRTSNNVVDFPKTTLNLPLTTEELKQRINSLIAEDPSQLDLEASIQDLAKLASRQPRDVWGLYNARLSEVEKSDERETIKKALPDLLEVKSQRLDPRGYLCGDGGVFAKQIIDTAKAMKSSPGFLVTTLISTCGASIGTAARIIINPRGSYTQPSVFRTCVVAPSGCKKSPAQAAIVDPLDEMEAEEYNNWKELQKQYKEDKARYDRDAKSNKKDEDIGQPPEEPIRKRYYTTDTTIESLIRVHSENPRGLLVYRDEWAGHFNARDKYRNGIGDDAENELSEFNGKSIAKDRTKESLYLPRTALSRTGSTQPETLKRKMGNHEDFSGEFARWLFCAEYCPPSYIDITSPGASEDTGLRKALRSLYEALHRLEPQDYFLSIEAKYVFEAYQHQLTDWTLAEHQPGLKTAYPKFESYFARLTLWLHIVNSVLTKETKPQQFISDDTVAKAAELTNYYIGQLRLIYAYNSPQEELKGRLLDVKQYVESKPEGVTPRQIRSGNWKFRKIPTSEIAQDCKTLESFKFIYSKDGQYFPGNGGDDDDETSPPHHQPPKPKVPDSNGSPSSSSGSGDDVDDVLMMKHHRPQPIDTTSSQPIDDVDDEISPPQDFLQKTNGVAPHNTSGDATSSTPQQVEVNPHHTISEDLLVKHHQHHQTGVTPSLTAVEGDDETSSNIINIIKISTLEPDDDSSDDDPDGGGSGNLPITAPPSPNNEGVVEGDDETSPEHHQTSTSSTPAPNTTALRLETSQQMPLASIGETLETPALKALFELYGGKIPLDQLTSQEREILAPYYLNQLLIQYDDIHLAQTYTVLGYSNSTDEAIKSTLERIKRHRKERDAVATKEGFAAYLPLLHSYDQSIEGKLLDNIKENPFLL